MKVKPLLYETKSDPRLASDGNSFKKPTLDERFRSFLTQVTLFWNAYFSLNGEKRTLFRQILKCNVAEKKLARVVREYFTQKYLKSQPANRTLFAVEHDFLEESSKLYRMLHDGQQPARLFPSELLLPYHWNVRGQRAWQLPSNIKPGDVVSDLQNTLPWLPQVSITDHPESRDHYSFVKAIDPAGDNLMESLRHWRQFLRFESGKAITALLTQRMDAVDRAWHTIRAHTQLS